MPQNRRTPLRTEGGRIVDADGNEVLITGVNWFGTHLAPRLAA